VLGAYNAFDGPNAAGGAAAEALIAISVMVVEKINEI